MNPELQSHDTRIAGVLSRLESVLDAENMAISSNPAFDFSQSNAIKSRCLYDITMLMRDVNARSFRPEHRKRLEVVRQKLGVNAIKVKAHLDAVRDIADLLKETVTLAEADGTYSMDQFQAYGQDYGQAYGLS